MGAGGFCRVLQGLVDRGMGHALGVRCAFGDPTRMRSLVGKISDRLEVLDEELLEIDCESRLSRSRSYEVKTQPRSKGGAFLMAAETNHRRRVFDPSGGFTTRPPRSFEANL